jgi:hypothetical protein
MNAAIEAEALRDVEALRDALKSANCAEDVMRVVNAQYVKNSTRKPNTQKVICRAVTNEISGEILVQVKIENHFNVTVDVPKSCRAADLPDWREYYNSKPPSSRASLCTLITIASLIFIFFC